jgi:hypothetical protein
MIPGLTCALFRQLSTTYCGAALTEPARVAAAADVVAAPADHGSPRLSPKVSPSAAAANPEATVVNRPQFMMFLVPFGALMTTVETIAAGLRLRNF